jgi:hypothetical protein
MYFIAIPSYQRSTTCNNKTLKCLHANGIDKQLINVFVIQEEHEEYLAKLNPDWYNQLIIGEKGLVQQREFIQRYYPVNTHIVSLDDDVEAIDLSLTSHTNLDEFFTDAFIKCVDSNAFLWSVYPVFNPFFRKTKKDTTEGLSFCIGAFYGYINRYDEDLKLTLTREGNKEDVERSILYWLKDGKTLRFNKVAFKTKYYGVGGLGGLKDRLELMKQYSLAIHEKYPEFTKIKIRKKNSLYEIVLKDKPIHNKVINDDSDITFLEPLNPSRDDLQEIYNMLESIVVPCLSNKSGRARTFGKHKSMTLGYIKGRVSRKYDLSYRTKKFPELYEKIKAFGETFVPFEFNAIHINHNVVCPRHLDGNNTSLSCLISLGDYEGCKLIIENIDDEIDTNCKPIVFDGTKHYHWNSPLISGNKYSLVFFTNSN